ncbi:hypothetical protein [Arthrobacter methylotrophus]|uniref:hypothetical protein n=1 Tax=Arthrobacter methylotrophus TaxID=121291 RepID=UPI0031E60682
MALAIISRDRRSRRGPYTCARAALPHLRKAGGGAIVVLTSQLGIVALSWLHPPLPLSTCRA